MLFRYDDKHRPSSTAEEASSGLRLRLRRHIVWKVGGWTFPCCLPWPALPLGGAAHWGGGWISPSVLSLSGGALPPPMTHVAGRDWPTSGRASGKITTFQRSPPLRGKPKLVFTLDERAVSLACRNQQSSDQSRHPRRQISDFELLQHPKVRALDGLSVNSSTQVSERVAET